MNYLDNGGNLYIESVNLGYDYHSTTFFEYLGLSYEYDGDEQEVESISGGEDVLSSGLNYLYYGGYSPHYSIDRLVQAGSNLLFASEDGYGRMFAYSQNDYKVISSSILLGALASGDSLNLKPYLVSEMVNYFLDYNPATSLEENITEFTGLTNYPNPFVSETNIKFNVNKPCLIKIDVYNAAGKLVKRLVENEYETGNYSVRWDGTNEKGNKVNGGLYFYNINNGDGTKTEKMILLR